MYLTYLVCCRCTNYAASSQLSKQPPPGWLHFQELMQQSTKAIPVALEQQDMSKALASMQEHLATIQQTTCLPDAGNSKLSSVSGFGQADKLQLVCCSVCHSLLLSAAFNKHLPNCRPSQVPANVSSSNVAQSAANGKAASALHKAGAQGKGKKNKQGKISKKPPAGPSRFAVEQVQQEMKQPLPRGLQANVCMDLLSRESHAQLASVPSYLAPSIKPESQAHLGLHSAVGAEAPAGYSRQGTPEAASRRLAWTYHCDLSRSNLDLDVINDPTMPPRFPYSACKLARRRSR